MNETNTRLIVLEILMRYEQEGTKLSPLLLDVQGKYEGMNRLDRAFVKALTEGVVERQIALDWVIDRVAVKKTAKMRPLIRMILREGVYQLLFMDHVPDSAAVNESVKLAGIRHMDGLKGFVNGVLRAVIRYRDKGIVYPDTETEFSVPQWIAKRLRREYGNDADAIMRASAGHMPVYLRINRILADRKVVMDALEKEGTPAEEAKELREVGRSSPGPAQELREAGCSSPGPGEAAEERMPYTLVIKDKGFVPSASESFCKGLYSVQDLSSQIAMTALMNETEVYINEKIVNINYNKNVDINTNKSVDINLIDLCASPGGKTCFAAESLRGMKDEHSIDPRITAYDLSEGKLERIRENIRRTGVDEVRPMLNDARTFSSELEGSADIVIADLPCSGLGVIGRKVDIKYRVREGDIAELCKLQRAMLDNAVRYLRPAGILMFSVCTITREETVDQAGYIEKLGLHKTEERQLLQGISPCDGFYYSIWRK